MKKDPSLEAPISLNMMDFNFGHYPDTKDPPWILNEIWMEKNKALCEEARAIAEQMKAGEERPLFGAVYEGLQIEVRVFRPEQKNTGFYLRAFPRNNS